MNIDIKRMIYRIVKHEQNRRINVSYRESFELSEEYFGSKYNMVGSLFYKDNYHRINYRHIISGIYRTKIVCFLTDKKTKYHVPSHY